MTGFDILFFWVARMIMLGLRFMGEVPFRDVYIHALVRDAEGQKMSKTKGNVVDPLVVMDSYGTDAFRFTLAALAAQGRDIRIAEERVEGYAQLRQQALERRPAGAGEPRGLPIPAAARRARLRWPTAGSKAACKPPFTPSATRARTLPVQRGRRRLSTSSCGTNSVTGTSRSPSSPSISGRRPRAQRTQHTLVTVLEPTLRLLHPLMPFITEEIWQQLPHRGESIMVAPYPRARAARIDAEAERQMQSVIDLVTAIRNIRGEMRIAPGVCLAVTVRAAAEHAPCSREQRL